QDTDALSTSLEADMPWIVKFDKPDFLGRHALKRVKDRGLRWRLIGFEMKRPSVIAEEGNQILAPGGDDKGARIVGRVTSARYSGLLGKSIGMGWVPLEMGEAGREILIQVRGRAEEAVVTKPPFYDPEGRRLRT
ncbi:MAG: glycine cleavage T C-terminal barrel domain-containing protein, partial [Nitrospinota bacterium]